MVFFSISHHYAIPIHLQVSNSTSSFEHSKYRGPSAEPSYIFLKITFFQLLLRFTWILIRKGIFKEFYRELSPNIRYLSPLEIRWFSLQRKHRWFSCLISLYTLNKMNDFLLSSGIQIYHKWIVKKNLNAFWSAS